MELGWAAELRDAPGVEPVMTAGALLSPDSSMPADHLVCCRKRPSASDLSDPIVEDLRSCHPHYNY